MCSCKKNQIHPPMQIGHLHSLSTLCSSPPACLSFLGLHLLRQARRARNTVGKKAHRKDLALNSTAQPAHQPQTILPFLWLGTWEADSPEPWVVLRVSVRPKLPRIEFGATCRARNTLVGPISVLQSWMASLWARM